MSKGFLALVPNVGPFSEADSEILTERWLDSKECYRLQEQLFRGDINLQTYVNRLAVAISILAGELEDERRQDARDAKHEPYDGSWGIGS